MPSRLRVLTWVIVSAAAGVLVTAVWRAPRPPQRATVAEMVPTPVVLGRPEACLVCHAGIEGLDASHRPEQIGCAACHGGDISARVADLAHVGLVRVPGNLEDAPRTCGQAACHPSIIPRIERSIMTTMAGVIAVDRRVFGDTAHGREQAQPTAPPHVAALDSSAADTHLRQLCASCHLGQQKTEWGPITEASRGGGCNACHLSYDSAAVRQLLAYRSTKPASRTGIPRRHPALTIAVDNGRCFGCHSRSARISTNYEGWHELRDAPSDAVLAADRRRARPQYRLLSDGRYFSRRTPDVHQERGMDCIDCHVPGEVMGAANIVARAREQAQIQCTDCHAPRLGTIPAPHADAETQALLTLRGWTFAPDARLAVTASGAVLSNVVVGADHIAQLRHKRAGTWAPLRAPAAVCRQGAGHSRLTCITCHSAWAPRCATCHTRFDPSSDGFDHVTQQNVRGVWMESSGEFEATPPTLGVRVDPRDRTHPHGVVDTFIPGMIITIDQNRRAGSAPDPVFSRLYARTFSHTIRREARSCTSCHADPVALGFGRGALRFDVRGGVGRWSFTPTDSSLADGLPADAWTGFLMTRLGVTSTRDDARPFLAAEQRRILTVGACLTCHEGTSTVMQRAINDFDATLARRSKRCVVPRWE